MTQIATVMSLPEPGLAEVTVNRQTACGHDCENCAGCGAQGCSVTVRARTDIPVVPGDRVEIYSDNRVLGIAALVYLVPLVLFLTCYLIPTFLSESLRYVCGGVGFLLGLLAVIGFDRRARKLRAITYEIARKL